MKTPRRLFPMSILLPLAIFGLVDCGPRDVERKARRGEPSALAERTPIHDPTEAGLDLSTVSSLSWSILRDYARTVDLQGTADIRYPFCVMADFPVSEAKRESYRGTMEQVANRWNAVLRGQPNWRVNSISFYLLGSATSCPAYDGRLRVYRVKGESARTRSAASYTEYTKLVGAKDFEAQSDRLAMHEYGHQLGLGDTYTEIGYQQPVGQPTAIMNNQYVVADLTQDDIDSVRHVWARVSNSTSAACPSGYVLGQVSENNLNHTFCVRADSAAGIAAAKAAAACIEAIPNALTSILHVGPEHGSYKALIADWAGSNCPNFDVVANMRNHSKSPEGCRQIIINAFERYLFSVPTAGEVAEWSKENYCQIYNVGDNIKSYSKSLDGCRQIIRNAFRRFGSVDAAEGDINEWAKTCNGENDVGRNIASYFARAKLERERMAQAFYSSGTFVAVQMILTQ